MESEKYLCPTCTIKGECDKEKERVYMCKWYKEKQCDSRIDEIDRGVKQDTIEKIADAISILDSITWKQRAEQAEARVKELDERNKSTYCAYCGEFFPADYDPDLKKVEAVQNHIKVCDKHPMRKLESRLAAAEEDLESYRECIRTEQKQRVEYAGQLAAAENRVKELEGALVSLECVIPEDYPKKGYPVVIHKRKYVVIRLSDFTEMQKKIYNLESRLAAAREGLEDIKGELEYDISNGKVALEIAQQTLEKMGEG